ncbi:helix-turn-helix domain-containing protein [Sulfuriflexus mobilis]|uniref:helix-turn-helix domain-containing protein n=1 Tax=Sulfuriflexus mobilis TaxID=1811807 RepID=UPI001559D43F|nr:helix-turn-helix transcriptional regulator [Sulfuriflexus mobilis]
MDDFNGYQPVIDGCISSLFETIKNIIQFHSAAALYISTSDQDVDILKIINHSFDADWLHAYVQNIDTNSDPLIGSVLLNKRPVMWDDSWDRLPAQNSLSSIGAMRYFGHSQGVIYPMPLRGTQDKYMLFVFAFDVRLVNASNSEKTTNLLWHTEILLNHVCKDLHRLHTDTLDVQTQRFLKRPLTDRETQVLEWATKGKTAWEIATILSISERTVKFHLSNIYQKLDVVNRQQAVARAVAYQICNSG